MAKPRTPAGRARESAIRLAGEYPGTAQELCALKFDTPFQLLVATILSAQTTDERVNLTTPELFAQYPDPASLAAADPERVEQLIKSTGFFRNKTRSIIGMAAAVVENFEGVVPLDRDELTSLPGVGRKTANVVRSVAFNEPGLPVDTHVKRVTFRLGITAQTDPEKIEAELMAMLPPPEWGYFSLKVILHGRAVCVARKPRCEECVLNDFCPTSTVRLAKSAK